MRYIVVVCHYQHAPFTRFAEAFECFREHVNANLSVSERSSCGVDEGFYLVIEHDGHSVTMGILQALELGEEIQLFDDEGNVCTDEDVEARVMRRLFSTTPIRDLARELGLLGKL